jgi:outer membrane protein TolC
MRRIIIFLLTLLAVSALSAQVRFSSLNDVLDFAGKNSLNTQAANLQKAAAATQYGLAKSNLMPKLSAFSTSEYFLKIPAMVVPASLVGGPEGKFTTVQFGMPYVLSSAVELNVPVLNLALWEQLKTARLRQQQVQLKTDAEQETLHIALSQLYYQRLFLEQFLVINNENQQSLNELVRVLEQRFAQGILPPADLNRIKSLALENKLASLSYRQFLQENEAAFRAALNLPDTTTIHIGGSLQQTSIEPVTNSLGIKDRPAYLEAQAAVAVAQQQFKEASKAHLPRIGMYSRYNYQWQQNRSTSVNFDAALVGLRLDVPIFNGGAIQKQKNLAAINTEAAKVQEQAVRNQLQQQHTAWQAKWNAAIAKDRLLQERLSLTKENLRIATLNLKEGVLEYDEFNNMYLEYNSAQVAFYQNRVDAHLYQLLLTKKL